MEKKHFNRKALSYGRKLYIGEFLAERVIQIIAFLSIGFIIAIFYYVFQEATYAFKSPHTVQMLKGVSGASDKSISSDNKEALKPASYGADENLKPATYGSSESDLKPESYGTETESLKPETYSSGNEELRPESYGTDANENIKPIQEANNAEKASPAAAASIEASAEEQPVSLKKLLMPNDYIDNKPDYIWQPISSEPKYSFIPLFVGALKVTLIGILIAAPIAILAAIFTVAFAPRWLKEIIKPAIEILAGFPSVVIGFFALMTLATVIQNVFGTTYRLNSFVGGLGMALAVIPIIYTVTEDALSAVPKYMKEASYSLGASRWQTAYRVMLPAATPGVFAAIILGFGRAFGETMIALMATGNAALVSLDLFESVRTMSATIGAEMAEVEFRGVHYGVLFLIGAVLLAVTFSLNAIAEFYVRKKLLKKFQGS